MFIQNFKIQNKHEKNSIIMKRKTHRSIITRRIINEKKEKKKNTKFDSECLNSCFDIVCLFVFVHKIIIIIIILYFTSKISHFFINWQDVVDEVVVEFAN